MHVFLRTCRCGAGRCFAAGLTRRGVVVSTGDAAIDLRRDGQLPHLDDRAVDRVKRGCVRVQMVLAHVLILQRALGLLPVLCAAHVLEVDGLLAAELDHRILEEMNLHGIGECEGVG